MDKGVRHKRGPDNRGSEPIRTCVGCRERAPLGELLRVVLERGRVVADPERRRPGRGAYVHWRPECVERAARGGLARGFRQAIGTAGLDALRALVDARADAKSAQ